MIAWLKWLWQGATRGERIGMVATLAFAVWTVGLFSFVSWQLLQEEPIKRSVRCGRCGAVWETESGSEAAIAECARFYPVFQFVLWRGKSPTEAISAALIDTAGEA